MDHEGSIMPEPGAGPSGPIWDQTPVPFEKTLDGTLGFEVMSLTDESARGRVRVTERVRQMWGLVHGGVYAALSEMLASEATVSAVYGDGMIAVGLSNHTSFLRPVLQGTVYAEARRLHRGKSTWLWEVFLKDDEDRLCAVSRVTLAIRPRPQDTG
jgi:1,4-dihydroxy-2-naphthoyl-CoA hydrolase